MDFFRGFKTSLVFLVVVASLGKGPSSPVLVKGEVEGSGQNLSEQSSSVPSLNVQSSSVQSSSVPEEEKFAYAMNCPNAALNFHGIGVLGYTSLSDAFYERKIEERAEVFDKFYRLYSQELVGALKLEESILIPSSLHIYIYNFLIRLDMVRMLRG